MEVGDYVRTKDGLISKYIGYEEDEKDKEYNKYNFNSKIYWFYEYYDDYVYEEDFKEWYEKKVIKTSPNIIDLIEENDLIEIEYKISTGENQKEIVQVIKNVNNKLFIKTYTEHYVFVENIEETIYKIKGIITKEQIASMEYKLGE